MAHSTRRDFLKTAAGVGLAAGLGGTALADAGKRTATDWVTLGALTSRSPGWHSAPAPTAARVQRELGQDEFTRLVRHAYDRGIRFFETAESYHGMPEMLATALKGLPRDSYRLMTKYSTPPYGPPPAEKIDQFRRQLNYRVHRHSAAALPAAAHLGAGLQAAAGRVVRGQGQEDHSVARRFRARSARAAHFPRQPVAGCRHDPHES